MRLPSLSIADLVALKGYFRETATWCRTRANGELDKVKEMIWAERAAEEEGNRTIVIKEIERRLEELGFGVQTSNGKFPQIECPVKSEE